jgi:long-chain fatty acid transport protein
MWKPMPNFSFGATYRSEIDQTLEGSQAFTYDSAHIAATINALTGAFSNSKGTTYLPTPQSVFGGARYGFDDHWTALAGVEWTNWSVLNQLLIQSNNPNNPSSLTNLNWKNTWFGSLGVEYRMDPRFTFRLGGAYDEAAAPSETVEPRIPDVNRYWLSGGVGYTWSNNVDFNLAVSHLFTPHSTIDQSVLQSGNALRGSLFGMSDTDATIVSLQLVLKEPFML